MTRKEKNCIRQRDRVQYCKNHGAIPAGYTLHHLNYSETYDESTFVIITNEEHESIHGYKIPSHNESIDYYKLSKKYISDNQKKNVERSREKCKKYRENHPEEFKDSQMRYHYKHKEERNEQSRNYNAKVKAVRMSNGLSCKEWNALTKEDRKRLMDTFMVNGGIMI